MKLFCKISPKTSAFILLFSFLGIYMINIGCSIGNVVEDLNWFSPVVEKHSHGSHDHGDGHNHDHGDEGSKKQENKNKDDGCCDDEASTFFASVQVAPISQAEYSFSFIQLTVLYTVVANLSNCNLSAGYFSNDRLPPDILPRFPDIRIAIQSFQI